jgi:nucleotide-binding universal stress UspA family protein
LVKRVDSALKLVLDLIARPILKGFVMKILIAYDGSEHAQAALSDLQRAGLPPAAEALVLSVAELTVPIPPLHAGAALAYTQALPLGQEDAAATAQEGLTKLQALFPGWQAQAQSAAGSPAWVIVQCADEWQPDLLIVGSQGRSALRRVLFGSVSQQLVNEARCSVRVGRAVTRAAPTAPRLLLALDGSAYADAALQTVAGRHWPPGTEVRLVTAVGPFSDMTVSEFKMDISYVQTIHQTASELLQAQNLIVSSAIKDGDPKQLILAQADEWQADTLLLGSRGLNRFHRFWLGSVSTAVVARAACSVEIVRTPEATNADARQP